MPLSDWDLPAAAAGDADGEGDPTPEVDANAAGGRSNAALLDDGSAQVLSMEDIEAMKAEGRAGADIVTALTTNSATFANKTEFSQAKYKCVGGWSGWVVGWVGRRVHGSGWLGAGLKHVAAPACRCALGWGDGAEL